MDKLAYYRNNVMEYSKTNGGEEASSTFLILIVLGVIIFGGYYIVKAIVRKTGNFLKNTGVADKFDDPEVYKAKQQQNNIPKLQQQIMNKVQNNKPLTDEEWEALNNTSTDRKTVK